MIIVTGATGFVGRYLVDSLVQKGEQVIACGRSQKYQSFFENIGVEFFHVDITRPDALDALPAGRINAFVHLAALIPAAVEDPNCDAFFRTNTLGTYHALEYCRRRDIKKFVFTTTLYECLEHTVLPISEAMGRRYSLKGDHALYVLSKIAASECVEHFSQEHGMQGIVLRFTGLLGFGRQEGYWAEGRFHPSAFEVFYRNAKEGRALEVWGAHQARRDSLYVKDAVEAIYAAIVSDTAQGLYCIGSGEGRTNEEEAQVFATVFGRPDHPIDIQYRPEIAEKLKSYYFDIGKANKELGWRPRFGYAQLLIDYDQEVAAARFAG